MPEMYKIKLCSVVAYEEEYVEKYLFKSNKRTITVKRNSFTKIIELPFIPKENLYITTDHDFFTVGSITYIQKENLFKVDSTCEDNFYFKTIKIENLFNKCSTIGVAAKEDFDKCCKRYISTGWTLEKEYSNTFTY